MALLLPYPEDFKLTENDCRIAADILRVSVEDAMKWGMDRQPITIKHGVDALHLTVQFNTCTYVVNERTFAPQSETTIYRAYDTMKLLNPSNTLELYWKSFKIPSTKEVLTTKAVWHYFTVKNNSDQECTVKILNGYWGQDLRQTTTYHDGIQYSEDGTEPIFA